jgi:hypothetical protein
MGNAFKLAQMAGEGARRVECGVARRLPTAPPDRLTDGKVIATRHYGLHEIFLLFLQPGCPGFGGYHINSDFVAVLAA